MKSSCDFWLKQYFFSRLSECLEEIGADASMRYATQEGKRIRPQMLFETACAVQDQIPSDTIQWDLATGAVALEMVHAYSLVHDDLPAMDNDLMRRGKPSVHAKFGEALGILCGDALLTGAFEVILQNAIRLPADRAVRFMRCGALLSECAGRRGMVGGQILDMNLSQPDRIKAEEMVKGKTAALFRAACGMGAILSGAAPDLCRNAEKMGEQYGMLFQLVDDAGDQAKDEADGKITYFGELADQKEQVFSWHEKQCEAMIRTFPSGEGLQEKLMTLRQAWASTNR